MIAGIIILVFLVCYLVNFFAGSRCHHEYARREYMYDPLPWDKCLKRCIKCGKTFR